MRLGLILGHSVEFQDFSIKQILRAINFGESKNCETAIFAILGAVNLAHLVNSNFPKMQKFIKIKTESL